MSLNASRRHFLCWLALILTGAASAEDGANHLEHGKLVICGGGPLSDNILARFVELAGGVQASLVVIPTASADADDVERSTSFLTPWKELGFDSVTVLHTRSRQMANTDAFIEPLTTANAVWISGGQQSRLSEVYVDTLVQQQLLALMGRGGVIGGTSAGAAMMSRVAIMGGNPEATIGKGFGLIPGTVVDQHFLARSRVNRLIGVLTKHPQLVGYGIDESTVMIVNQRRLEVMGDSYVVVCRIDPSIGLPRFEILQNGSRIDLYLPPEVAASAGSTDH